MWVRVRVRTAVGVCAARRLVYGVSPPSTRRQPEQAQHSVRPWSPGGALIGNEWMDAMLHYLLLSDKGGALYPLQTLEGCLYSAFLFSFFLFLVNVGQICTRLRFEPDYGNSRYTHNWLDCASFSSTQARETVTGTGQAVLEEASALTQDVNN